MDVRNETDIERLRQLAQLQQSELVRLSEQLRAMAIENARLKGVPVNEELKLLMTKLNGGTSAADCAASPAKPNKKRKKRERTGPTAQPKLERQAELYELDEADRVCPSCGGELVAMAGQTEDSELIDTIAVQYVVKEVKRQKYSCRCGCMETAIGPARVKPGSRYSLDFGLQVCVAKYLDHLPLERQARMMKRAGLTVTSQTLWNLVWDVATYAVPTWQALLADALRGGIIGLDQTGWPRLDDRSQTKWQMWCVTTPRIVYHEIRDDKSAETFEDLVGDYDGYIVCDDLSTHRAGARGSPGVVLVGCWAHIYRKFEEASSDHPDATTAMELIRWLYDVDKYAPAGELGEMRARWSKLVLDELYRWMTSRPIVKTTSIGRAILHTLKNKERLWRIVDDEHVWLDNNPTERAIRGPVVGRRNHFGSKSRRGTQAASVLYSLIETAKLNGIDPATYLRAVVVAAQERADAVVMPWDLAQDDSA